MNKNRAAERVQALTYGLMRGLLGNLEFKENIQEDLDVFHNVIANAVGNCIKLTVEKTDAPFELIYGNMIASISQICFASGLSETTVKEGGMMAVEIGKSIRDRENNDGV